MPPDEALDWAAAQSAVEGIRQGLEDLAAGRTRPAREVIAELRAEFEIVDCVPRGGSQ